MVHNLVRPSQALNLDRSIKFLKDITTLSSLDQTIPYIISPRNTLVETRRPKLHWNKVTGATCYTVKIVTDGKIIWSQQVQGNEFTSSEDLPLEIGKYYSLVVDSDNGRSSQAEPNQSLLLFGLLDSDKQLTIAHGLSLVEQMEVPKDRKIRAEVDIYISHQLSAKAVEILEQKIVHESRQSSLLYQDLGNLYQCMGFYELAEATFKQALALLKEDQLEETISVKTGLADVLTFLNKVDEAQQIKTELDILLAANTGKEPCAAACPGSCGECLYNGDPNQPGKWYGLIPNRRCLTVGC